jgi:hypothetical protein
VNRKYKEKNILIYFSFSEQKNVNTFFLATQLTNIWTFVNIHILWFALMKLARRHCCCTHSLLIRDKSSFECVNWLRTVSSSRWLWNLGYLTSRVTVEKEMGRLFSDLSHNDTSPILHFCWLILNSESLFTNSVFYFCYTCFYVWFYRMNFTPFRCVLKIM